MGGRKGGDRWESGRKGGAGRREEERKGQREGWWGGWVRGEGGICKGNLGREVGMEGDI